MNNHMTHLDNDSATAAATLIQKHYRGYRARRQLDGLNISADCRWTDALHRLRLEQVRDHAIRGKNDTTSRWKRGGFLAHQLAGGGDRLVGKEEQDQGGKDDNRVRLSSDGLEPDGPVQGGPSLKPSTTGETVVENTKIGNVSGANDGENIDNIPSIAKKHQFGLWAIERWTRGTEAQQLSKMMEEQYWLEMVDSKHRYGSNLLHYHSVWAEADTKQNFFQWLDQGEGQAVDLPECPRERLDSERIIYLSAEQRKNYIVDVRDGKLIWRRNGKPVDTARGKHRDLGDGRGIVELGSEEQQEERKARRLQRAVDRQAGSGSLDSNLSASLSSDDSDEQQQAAQDARHYQSKPTGKKRRLDGLLSSNWSEMLLRKTIGSNTWIYVLNARHELYVGLKMTGYFQHSSFLYGGRVVSAGLLKVDNGTLTSISPLSGHYRAGTAHFRYFVKQLQDGGVDLDRVTLSKSLLLLAAMEKYGKLTSKKSKDGHKHKGGTNNQPCTHNTNQDGKVAKLSESIKDKLLIGPTSTGPSMVEKIKDKWIPGRSKEN